MPGRPYSCSAETRTCECASKPRVTKNTTAVDGTDWRGDSFCDKIMRGYHEKRVTNPLEKAWTERCTYLRTLGQNIVNFLRLQSVLPDIIYNPRRALQISYEMFEGLSIFYFEGFVDRGSNATAMVEYFNTLVERKIDPIMMFRVLEFSEDARAIFTEISKDVNTSKLVDDATSVLPENIKNSVQAIRLRLGQTVNITQEIWDFGRTMGKSA
jgi:hypothetical protein